MSIFDDFDGMGKRIDRDRARFLECAKSVPAGLPREQLVPGAIVTCGPHKLIADRSYLEKIFEIIASNAATVVIKQVFPEPVSKYSKEPVVLAVHEMDFYSAEHFLEAIRSRSAEKAAEESSAS